MKCLMKKFHAANIILLICALGCLICYDIFGGLWLKGFTSTWFVILGAVNVIYAGKNKLRNDKYIIIIEIGLILGMCADVLLGVQFILGILSFALGHVMYLVAFYKIEKARRKDWLIILPIAVVSIFVVTGTPYIQITDPFLKKLLIGYAFIIACMLGKAISNFTEKKSMYRKLILLGSVMFWFSDVMLAIDMFGEASRLTWVLCSYTYWPAQNILAFSLFYYINERCAQKEVMK